jgi:hypothetical protein
MCVFGAVNTPRSRSSERSCSGAVLNGPVPTKGPRCNGVADYGKDSFSCGGVCSISGMMRNEQGLFVGFALDLPWSHGRGCVSESGPTADQLKPWPWTRTAGAAVPGQTLVIHK